MPTFDEVRQVFANNGCRLLTTQDEFNAQVGTTKNKKYKYVASCGHQHIVFYNVFKSRGTGIKCPACVCKENAEVMKDKIKDDKIIKLKTEKKCIDYFVKEVEEFFTVVKAFDGCKVDIILKPKMEEEDLWLGIQVKTCESYNGSYGFHVDNQYPDCLMLLICWEDKRMWGIPFEDISNNVKISIGKGASKYSKYEIEKDDIWMYMFNMYNEIDKFPFDILDKPIALNHQKEQLYCKHREECIPFVKFVKNGMEGLVYDFKIGDKKVQEKVGTYHKGGVMFTLSKNNGKVDGKKVFTRYEVGDNDIYWLHVPDKKTFYVIPEQVMIEHDFVGPKNNSRNIMHFKTHDVDAWQNEYKFDYEGVDKDRLLSLISI